MDDLRERAVSLVERLVAADEETLRLRIELDRLQRRASGLVAGEPPSAQHAWKLRDDPRLNAARLGFYEHRVDDPAILAARDGAAFLKRLERSRAAAVVSLRNRPSVLRTAQVPDVSVILPVHGQLQWTLNCLDALADHVAAARVEVLVIDDASRDDTPEVLRGLADALPWLRYHRLAENAGFVGACNEGASVARGETLVLLNNDTRVVPGWLDALLETLSCPACGLAGSKLLYPDGSLQEAGGIVWRDGSAWNYGRGDDPNRPHYAHARRVDYVSGASIALRRATWEALGGLDRSYAPAYGEDVDLAFRVRASGLTVWYQPQSRVIHYEGKSAGTDTSRGMKAYQVVNQRKLFLRWRGTLTSYRRNGEAPYLERDRDQHRRALVVDATNPTPKQDAGSVTTTLTLRLFEELGYKPYFVPQDNFLFEPEHTGALLRMGVECAYAPYESNFADYIARYGSLFDVVLVFRVGILDRVLQDLRRWAPGAPVLFHNMDLHYLRMEREAALSGSAEAHVAAAEMKAREIALMREVDCTITHSTFERAVIASEAPEVPVVVWPFMFPFHGTQVAFKERRDFCFLGGYRHAPNIDAVVYFAREVLPLVRKKLPQARFIIAGANPGPEVQALASKHVVVTGMIDDLRDLFDTVRVFACSLRVGAGVKGKVSTAMSYGLPVVSTSCGAEGMDLIDGEEVLVADDPASFAAACVRLHEDSALWQRLSRAGQDLVREKHSLEMGRRVLAEAIEVGFNHHYAG